MLELSHCGLQNGRWWVKAGRGAVADESWTVLSCRTCQGEIWCCNNVDKGKVHYDRRSEIGMHFNNGPNSDAKCRKVAWPPATAIIRLSPISVQARCNTRAMIGQTRPDPDEVGLVCRDLRPCSPPPDVDEAKLQSTVESLPPPSSSTIAVLCCSSSPLHRSFFLSLSIS